MDRKLAVGLAVVLIAASFTGVLPAFSSSCGITVNLQPSVVNYPFSSLPLSSAISFSETVDVNYSSAFINRTITVQYLSGTDWVAGVNFTGNFVGYTRTYFALVSNSSHFGVDSVRAVSGACASGTASFTIQHDPGAVALDVLLYAGVALSLFLFYESGQRLGRKKFLFIAAAVYLGLAPFTGHRYDVFFLVSSGIHALQNVNPFGAGSPAAYPGALKWAYPPLYVPYSALSYLAYQLLTGAPLPTVSSLVHPSWLTSTFDVWEAFTPPTLPVLVALLKVPMVVSALLLGVLLEKMTGTRSALVGWLANPLVILVAAVWGQLDPMATLLAVGAVYMFERNKPYHAYLLASFGAAVKVWPALLVPLFLVVSLRRVGRRALKPLSATLPAIIVTLAIYAAFGNLAENLYVLAYSRFVPTFGGAFVVNGLTWQQILAALGAPPVPVFTLVGIPSLAAVVIWVYYKREENVVKWLIVSLMIVFLTYNFVNPQYFYWIVPFLLLERRKFASAIFSLVPMMYVAFAYNIFYFVSPALLLSEYSIGASVVEQLKVSAFGQIPGLVGAALLPTVAYALLLYYEISRRGVSEPRPAAPGMEDARRGT